ncbi:uncharacterized protein TRUGW13939_03912 [Talaromyces rugulosus]|uniref:Altered inheritance of mitochondria protein 9, mitochondrial n=1 Tax=Talaromyces rugulosus TaxID=121627 RepID=A0A7H8QTJ9_TALRU|nr:uncharacterized protein TRUGW13939_03912 [Talaromyces rugulosus]QKX56805.1 hypothetical protein TRUGW13939_03912 [Talaromyces rugulosus]
MFIYDSKKAAFYQMSREELFQYTNGRFLSDDKFQISKRYVHFNIEELCDVIANISPVKSSVSKIEKMEGGFSKALLITTEDASEYIVKIPCPNAGRPMYCTASEVAVLRFIRNHTTIPVPKVLAWSSDASNPIGAEYIIMEKVPGVQVFKKWDDMGEYNRLSLIKRLTQWERELSEVPFPAYGSLYYRSALKETERIPLDSSIDSKGEFCIGPSCEPSWLLQSLPDFQCGPLRTLREMGESLIDRSTFKVNQRTNTQCPSFLRGSTEVHLSLLHMAKIALPAIADSPKFSDKAQPILWHTDLLMGNIFVSENDPGTVTGIIDWQNTVVNPTFLQVRWPIFLTSPEEYQEGQVMPGLPADFEELDEGDKEMALYNKAQATWTKAYEVASFLNNRKAWQGMQITPELKEIFRRCGETWDEGLIPLREVLIEIFLNQEDLGLASESSRLSFTEEQIAQHKQEFAIYEEWHDMRKFAKEMLDTDDEGWVSPERELDKLKSRNKMLFEYYVTKTQKSFDEVKSMWPFPLDT